MIYEYLSNLFSKGKLTNSWLIESNDLNNSRLDLQKFISDRLLTKIDLANNPDFMLIKCEEDGSNAKHISVAQIRKLQSFLYKTASLSHNKVAVIYGAEMMNINSANCALKILEDTPKDSYIFLLTNNISSILPTIKSRCAVINAKIAQIKINEDYDKCLQALDKQVSFEVKWQIIKEFSEKNKANWIDFADSILLFISKICQKLAGTKIILNSLEQEIIDQLPKQNLSFLLRKYEQINQLISNTRNMDLELKASTILLIELLYQDDYI